MQRGCLGWLIVLFIFLEIAIHTRLSQHYPFNALKILHFWWYVPIVLLWFWLLWQKHWRLFGGWGILLSIWGLTYLGYWFPAAAPEAMAGRNLRVLTWNVWGGNTDAPNILDVIQHEQPDLILLQEVDENLRLRLAEGLRERYPFYEIRLPTKPGLQPSDLAVFSRYPLTPAAVDCPYWDCYRRTLQVDHPTGSFLLANVHIERSKQRELRLGKLIIPFSMHIERETQIVQRLVDDLQSDPSLVMTGDFNLTDHQAPYQQLHASWADSWLEVGQGMGFTWPETLLTPALVRIDYVWHTAEWQALSAHTGVGTSDHRYLLVELQRR